MNFHPDYQLFQLAGSGDRTADPWITSPTLPPYTTGDSYQDFLRTMSSIDLISLKIQILGENLFINLGFKSPSGKVKSFLSRFLFIFIFSIKN
jgi:hypothetical protein